MLNILILIYVKVLTLQEKKLRMYKIYIRKGQKGKHKAKLIYLQNHYSKDVYYSRTQNNAHAQALQVAFKHT